MLKRRKIVFMVLLAVFAISVFAVLLFRNGQGTEPEVLFVSNSEARERMAGHPEAFILDVRSPEEFNVLRIPGSINIPHSLIASYVHLLPQDKNALIFAYCRTGVRVRTAVYALLDMGYTNIVVFPGMATWDYETVASTD